MRIVAIEPIIVDVPLREPVQGVHGTTAMQRSVLVRIEADPGNEGWGNVDPTPGYSLVSAEDIHRTVARALAPALLGADAFNINAALARMVLGGDSFAAMWRANARLNGADGYQYGLNEPPLPGRHSGTRFGRVSGRGFG